MSTADYFGPDTYVPTMAEAERDEHEHSRCTFAEPCAACRREQGRRGR